LTLKQLCLSLKSRSYKSKENLYLDVSILRSSNVLMGWVILYVYNERISVTYIK